MSQASWKQAPAGAGRRAKLMPARPVPQEEMGHCAEEVMGAGLLALLFGLGWLLHR